MVHSPTKTYQNTMEVMEIGSNRKDITRTLQKEVGGINRLDYANSNNLKRIEKNGN